MPSPVHSCLLFASSSAAAPVSALAVELIISMVALIVCEASSMLSSAVVAGIGGRDSNQLLFRSKKHRSDQLQDVRKRMIRRKLQ